MTKLILKLIFLLGIPLALGICTYLWLDDAFLQARDPSATEQVLVEIQPGSTIKTIGKQLESLRLVNNWWSLYVIARIKRNDTKITAGEFELSAAMSPKEILDKLASGDVFKRTVTFKEGMSIWDLGEIIEHAGLLSRVEFNAKLTDKSSLVRAGISADSFEGYLFPETYFFSRPITAEKIIWSFLEEGEKNWPPEYSTRSEIMGFSRHETLTLAAMIEKESGNVYEQPIISSVFHNRLRLGMRLQSDPTVVYGIPNFSGKLRKSDLEGDHPYNTYTRFGLPPGPIANPGATAIKAALYPDETEFLFFVADGKGGHVFSTTLREHNKAVHDYRETLRAQEAATALQPNVDVVIE